MPADVDQTNVALLDHPRTNVHVPFGDTSQNSYCALGQPLALPVTETIVPLEVALAGDVEAVIAVHGIVVSG
jgi:hypothetical protein